MKLGILIIFFLSQRKKGTWFQNLGLVLINFYIDEQIAKRERKIATKDSSWFSGWKWFLPMNLVFPFENTSWKRVEGEPANSNQSTILSYMGQIDKWLVILPHFLRDKPSRFICDGCITITIKQTLFRTPHIRSTFGFIVAKEESCKWI